MSRKSPGPSLISAALIDYVSGGCLGGRGGQAIDMELAGAAVTEVIRSKRRILDSLGLDESIDEIIVTLGGQYPLLQAFDQHDGLFSYLILDRERSSLPLARTDLRAIERDLVFRSA